MSELLKRPGTMLDVYRLLPEGTPIQLINNEFHTSPAPNFSHFNTVDSIIDSLKEIVANKNSGRVIFAPVEVFPGEKNVNQPDIFYISYENSQIISESGIYDAPDIVIEVLSPGNQNAGLVKKKMCMKNLG
jgi:Uma2 family endonuclease